MAGTKECRLCAQSTGPFFNIFGLEVDLANRIRALLPFEIVEWDNLPHKICYRCSAKVAELHEFVQKCKESQRYFNKKFGTSSVKQRAKKARESWEASLQAKKISNDEYCDELIKKALQSLPNVIPSDELNRIENDTKMSRAKVVISKFDSNIFPTKKKDNVKSGELSENITFLDVSDVDSIYSCKICNKIFTMKDKIKNHTCIEKELLENKSSKNTSSPETTPPVQALSNNLKSVKETDSKSTKYDNALVPRTRCTRLSKKLEDLKKSTNKSESEKSVPITNIESTTTNSSVSNITNPVTNVVKSVSNIVNNTPASGFTLANDSSLLLVQMPNGDYIVVQNPMVNPNASENNNSNTNITNTNVTINAPRLYNGLHQPSNNYSGNQILTQSTKYLKSKRKTTPQMEPYPVGLFCRSSNDLNMDQNEDPIVDRVDQNQIVDMPFKDKQYKIMPHQKPGKLVIKTTTVDRNGISNNSHHKKAKKAKKVKSLKHYTSKSTSDEVFSVEDDKPIYTFFNIDPMSNPSYVLSTPNTVQESQISTTATPGTSSKLKTLKLTIGNKNSGKLSVTKNDHKCYICDQIFESHTSLVNHIDTHFLDDLKNEKSLKNAKKRKR